MKKVLLIALTMGLILMIGCSDDQKEEAAQLEREMMQDTAAAAMDADTVSTPMDTVAAPPQDVDAGAVPEEETPGIDMPARPSGSGYAVQIAGCEDPDYAEHLVSVYQRRGYEPYVSTFTKDGQLYYRVRLGLFDTLDEAKQMQAELNDRFSIYPWVDQVQP